jgi:serine/threonine protein kinase
VAPEVIELNGATPASDIWSLGATIIELVDGRPPYSDLVAMSAMFRIVEDEMPPLPEGASEELKAFLKRCFRKNPQERPTAEELFDDPWLLAHYGVAKVRPLSFYPLCQRCSLPAPRAGPSPSGLPSLRPSQLD